AEVACSGDSPVLENRAGHQPPTLERQVAAARGEFRTADVTWFAKPFDREVQGRQNEEIRRLVVRRVAPAEAVDDVLGEEDSAHRRGWLGEWFDATGRESARWVADRGSGCEAILT